MDTVIIGDVHNRVDLACKIMNRHGDSTYIFMGDYFDSFTDNPNIAAHTAHWLKDSLKQPNRIHLWGNHDIQYAHPSVHLQVTGYTVAKNEVIGDIMKHEDWSRLKFFHVHDDWWLSHAGITREWFEHPVHGLNQESVEREIQRAEKDLAARRVPMSLCSYDDMSDNPAGIGGLLWVRWDRLECIDNINQMVGHTQRDRVWYKRGATSMNINVDCLYKEYVVIDTLGTVCVRNTKTGALVETLRGNTSS